MSSKTTTKGPTSSYERVMVAAREARRLNEKYTRRGITPPRKITLEALDRVGLSSRVRLLVLDHPTRGVDVGAKEEIYKLIRDLAKDGIGMVIMCDTLEEDIGLSNRMLIMKDGRLVKEVDCPPNKKPTPGDIIDFIV